MMPLSYLTRLPLKKAPVMRALCICVTVLLSSCFGVSSEITIKKDGSGTIAVEYHISEEMLSLGTLDGNEAFPSIPVGEEDFKRTIARIDGLSLKKFSSKTVAGDRVYQVTIDFTHIEALLSFLDTQGQLCTLTEKDGKHILTVVFIPGTDDYQPEMLELMPVIFNGYTFQFKITMPGKSETVFYDHAARQVAQPPTGSATISANSVSFTAPMGDIFSNAQKTTMEIRW